jgi:putative tricarboxylic transport membrane protein
VFGLSMVAMTGGDSMVKNLIAGAFGVMLATVGQDITTGVERYTFGVYIFSDGIDFIPVLIGLFALAELLEQAAQLGSKTAVAKLGAVRLPSWADLRKCWRAIWLSSGLGTFIGVLPALGATTAAMIAYVETKRWSKNPEEFGKGAIEGVAGPEAANNAAVGGAMVPTLALGIPGSTTTAIILAGLLVQGVRPGPHLFNEQPLLLYAVFSSMLLANLLYLALGLGFAKLFARISFIPPQFLWPAVFVLSVIGAYAPNQAMAEVWVAIAFGFIGFFMRRFGFAPAPLVIGLVLGKLVEETLKQSLIIFDLNWSGFLGRPIALTLFALTVLFLLLPPWLERRRRRRG